MGSSSFAMENRDPNNLNPHLQVMWDDIIGEPEGLATPEGCWNCSSKCYDGTRKCCYILLAVIFAPFIAFCTGCQFACIAFNQIWCATPCLRMCKINLASIRQFWYGCLLAICAPCAEMCGMYMNRIKVRYQKLPDGDDSTRDEEFFHV